MNEQEKTEWLKERSTYVGATDVAKIMGVHPYGTPHDVWLEKRGELTIEETVPMWLGTEMEPIVAKHFALRYPDANVRESRLYRHEKYPFCACNPDREITWEGQPALLECKTAGYWTASQFGEDGSDAIPAHYLVQVLWQLIITRVKVVVLYVLLDNREFKPYIYTLDPELSTIAHVFPHEDVVKTFSAVVSWWNRHMVECIEPQMTGRDPDSYYLRRERSTYENGGRSNTDQEIDQVCRELEGLLIEEKRAVLAAAEAKNKIKKFMAERQCDTLDWGDPDEHQKPFTWKKDVRGVSTFRTPFKTGNA